MSSVYTNTSLVMPKSESRLGQKYGETSSQHSSRKSPMQQRSPAARKQEPNVMTHRQSLDRTRNRVEPIGAPGRSMPQSERKSIGGQSPMDPPTVRGSVGLNVMPQRSSDKKPPRGANATTKKQKQRIEQMDEAYQVSAPRRSRPLNQSYDQSIKQKKVSHSLKSDRNQDRIMN